MSEATEATDPLAIASELVEQAQALFAEGDLDTASDRVNDAARIALFSIAYDLRAIREHLTTR